MAVVLSLYFIANPRPVEIDAPALPEWTLENLPPISQAQNPLFTQQNGYERLKKLGFTPSIALEIGAANGNWAKLVSDVFTGINQAYLISASLNATEVVSHSGFPYVSIDLDQLKASAGRLGNYYKVDRMVAPLPKAQLVRFNVHENCIAVLDGAAAILLDAEVLIVETELSAGHGDARTRSIAVLSYLAKRGFQLIDVLEFLKFVHHTSYVSAIDHVTLVLVHKQSALQQAIYRAAAVTG